MFIARLKSMDTRPSDDGGGTTNWRLAGYAVMQAAVLLAPRDQPMPGAGVLEDDLAHGLAVGRGVGLEATRQDPAGVGGIAGSAAVGAQVRGVRMPGPHDGPAVAVGHLGDGVAEGHRQPHLVQRSEPVHPVAEDGVPDLAQVAELGLGEPLLADVAPGLPLTEEVTHARIVPPR